MKLERLSGRKTNEFLLRKGQVWKGKTMTIYWMQGMPRLPRRNANIVRAEGLYVGTFASTRLHKSAVMRNRMRRRIREALRLELKESQGIPSAQLLLTPRSASLDAPFEDIQRDVRTFLTLLTSPWPTPRKAT